MRIAITGATGFIGRPLCRMLVEAGHDLVVLSRRPHKVTGLPSGSSAAFFDFAHALDPAALEGADAVIHLAGENLAAKRWTEQVKQSLLENRTKGTENVARAARASGSVRTFVSASAVGYYGDRGAEPLTEDSAPGSDFLAHLCLQWERSAKCVRAAGIREVSARMGVVLHPEGGALAKMLLPFRMGVGGTVAHGEQYMSWVHRTDACRLLVHALESNGIEGALNVTAPQPVTNREFTKALGRALHRPTLMPLPGFALKAVFGEMATVLLGSQRVLPQRAESTGFTFQFPTLAEALDDLLRHRRR